MTFYKVFIPSGKKVQISREEAYNMISSAYRVTVAGYMKTLINEKHLGLGFHWNLFYEPTPENYCKEQGCESNPERCGYYPSMCIKEKYGVE